MLFRSSFEFQEKRKKFDQDETEWIQKMIEQLHQTFEVGKPLGTKWFKEKKYRNKRLYFLIYPWLNLVILVGYGTKKDQEQMIQIILKNKDAYMAYAEHYSNV